MKKKIVYGIFIVLALLIVIVVVVNIFRKKEEELQKVRQSRLELYSDAVNITGDFVVEGDTFTINNKEYNEVNMIREISLYNAFYKEEQITVEELMAEFDAFTNGMNESDVLENYQENMRSLKVRCEKVEIFVRGYDYQGKAYNYLEEIYGAPLDFDALTIEDWEKAYEYAAERIYNEVLELEGQK